MNKEKKSHADKAHACPYCSKQFKGNGFFYHRKVCEHRPDGATTKLYPVSMPKKVYDRFREICDRANETIADRVRRLIRLEVDKYFGPD